MSDQADTLPKLRAKVAQCEEDSKRAAKIQAALYEVANAASAVTEMQAFYAKLHAVIGDLMYARNFFIATYDETSGMLSWPYHMDEKDVSEENWAPELYKEGKSITSYVLRTGKSEHALTQNKGLLESGEIEIIGTLPEDAIFVPLMAADKALGALGIQSYTKGIRYSEDDVQLLLFVAQHIAQALTRARALEETRQRNSELQIINSVQQGLASKLDMQAIYDLVGDTIRRVFPEAQEVGILTYDPITDLLYPRFAVERGVRLEIEPWKPMGFRKHVLLSRQPMVINRDAERLAAEYNNPVVAGEKAKSFAFVPLIVGQEVTGIIELEHIDREDAFSEADVRLLETLANSMSVALENARLFKAEQQRAAELAIINSVQEGLASKLDFQAIINLVGQKVGEIFKADTVYIAQFDAANQLFRFPYYVDKGYPTLSGTLPLGQGLTSVIFRTRQPLVLGTGEEQLRQGGSTAAYEAVSEDQNKSYLGVPILLRGEVTGVVSVQKYDEHAFAESDARLLATLANSMGVALENARLFDETQLLFKAEQQRAAELAIINSVQDGLASKLDYQAIIDLVGDQVRETFKSDTTYIFLYDRAANLIRRPYYVERGFRHELDPLVFGEGLTSVVINTRKPLLIGSNDENDELNVPGSNIASPEQEKDLNETYLGVPIVVGDEVMGVVSVQSYQKNAYGDGDIRLLQTLANSMSVALENARLFDEVQKRNQEISEALEQQTATTDVLRVIAGSPSDIQPVLEVIAEHAMRLCEGINSSVYLTDGKLVYEAVSRDASPEARELNKTEYPRPLAYDSSLSSRAILGKAVLNIADSQNDPSLPELTRQYSRVLGMKSILFVPLLKDGDVRGALAVSHGETGLFSEKQVALLQTFADQAVIAIENVRLFNETKRLLKETEQRAAELAIINSVQEGLASKLDMQAIYDLVGEKIREIFQADTTYICSYEGQSKAVRSHFYVDGEQRLPPQDLPFGQGMYSRVIQTRRPILIETGQEEEAKGSTEIASPGSDQDLNQAALYVPILMRDDVKGVVSVQSHKQYAYTESDSRLLGTLASSLGVALENARLFDEVQRRNQEITEALEQQTATSEILRVIASSPTDIQPVLDAVAESAARLCDSYDAAIARVEGNVYRVVSQWGPVPLPEQNVREGIPLDMETVTGRAILEKRPIHVDDVMAEPESEYSRSKGFSKISGQRTLLATPLMREGRAIGAIFVRRQEVNPFTDKQANLLKVFADQAAIAIENVRLFDETKRLLKETEQRAAELAIINSVQEGLATKLDMQAIYELIGDKIRDIFDAQSVLIGVFDHTHKIRHIPYGWEKGQRLPILDLPFNKFAEHLIKSKQALVINDNAEQTAAQYGMAVIGGEMMKSGVWVPLIAAGEVTGFVSLQNADRENAFPEAGVRLLQTLANSMSVALENARLFDETQRLLKETEQRAAELSVINSVQKGLASKLDMQAIYDLVGDKIRDIFRTEVVYIAIRSAEREEQVDFPYYLDRGSRLSVEPVTLGQGITSRVIESRQAVIAGSMKEQIELGGIYDDAELSQSYLGVPIFLGDEVMGVASVQSYRTVAFTDADVRLLTTLAASMGVALENARLFDETQRLLKQTDQRAAELAIINSVQEGLAAKLEAQAIYDLVGDKIGEIHPNVDVGIRILDPHANLIHYPYIREKGKRIEIPSRPPAEKGFVAHVLRTRQILAINENMAAVQEEYGSWVLPGTEVQKSAVYAPVFIGGEARGVVGLGSSEREHAFTDADVRLLQTLASSMGIALEKAGLFEAERKRAAELSAISTVSQALVAETELDSMVQLVGKQLRDIFSADIVYVALLNRQTNMIEFPYQFGEEIAPRRLGEGLTSKIIETGQPVLINQDVDRQLAGLGAQKVGVEARSYLGVPILAGRQAIGVISVQSTKEENAFNEDDMRLLSTIAANAGSAIQTARLHAETQRRAQEMATLAEIGNDIASSRELTPVLERIAAHAKEILNVSDIAIRLLEADGKTLSATVALGTYAAEYKAVVLRMGEGLTGAIAASGVAEFINNPARDPRVIHVPGTPEEEDAEEGMMVAPLTSRGQTIGVIGVWRPNADGVFTQAELDFLVSVARQTAIAIESARLYLETQRRANEMSALTEVGREISASLDPAVVLNLIASRARELLSADTSAVYLLEADKKSLRAITAIGNLAEDVKSDAIKLGEGIIGSLAQESKGEFVNDPAHDPRAVDIPGTAEIPDERLMAAPLLKGDEVVGMLAVWRGADPFTEADLNFLAGLARQASIGLENARLFAEIRSEKQYSEALVQNSPVAIMSIDTDASVVAWNPGAEKLFGYSAQEALGRNIDDLVANDPGIREEAGGFFTRLGGAEQIHAITKRTRKDGTFVDVEVSGVPVVVDGKHEGLIGIYHDITELQRARQEAVAANEAKSAFLATMSHEIRTPMNAVIGMSGLLMDTELNKEQFDYAETIRNSGDALLAIINDILDFSKIEAGKMELEHQPFDLRECVESALDLVAGRAVEKRIDLAYIIDDDVPLGINGDVTRLRQILLNLMSNAVKFTEKGEVVLTVKQDKAPNRLLIAVRDTGIGIPADRMGRLFESFSQADSSTTRRFGGTGLGLVISKRLAEMMGGRMWVESPGAGKGSTFAFTMQAEAAHIAERRTARDIKGIQPSLAGKRVLIVDDNATNRRILMLQTQKWGMAPRETESPREALKWLKTDEAFDLAILDVQMPEMDGLMLTRELRTFGKRAGLPIILLTSLGRKEIGAEALDFAAYLSKPLKPSALFDALAGIFARNVVVARAQPVKSSADDDLGKRHPLRILLAEDNAVNQKLALRLLEQMGYRADVASNGLEAVESLERQAYDVILMDVQMPEMDGLDATRAIRRLTNVTQPRVVAMTANAMQGDREMCLAAGMDDYVSKPIRVAELKEALQKTKSLATAASSKPRRTESSSARPKAAKRAKKASTRVKGRAKAAPRTPRK